MTHPNEESVREAWAVLQAVRTACETRIRRSDHRPLVATLCYDPSEPDEPYVFGFANSRGRDDELPFFMLCEQVVTAAQTLGIGGILPEYLSAAGQWCLIMTRVMPLPHPLRHGVWVSSKQIDPSDQVFDEFPDVFTMTAQVIGFMVQKHRPALSPEQHPISSDSQKIDAPQPELISQPPEPMTELQQSVWNALEGRSLTEKELKKVIGTGCEVRSVVARIKASGRRVENCRGVGYYRPDAPPPDRG